MECTQLAFSCSKLAVETPEHWEISGIILVSLLLTLSRFHTLFWCFHCWLWTNKCQLGQSVSVKKFTCSKVESKIVEKGVRTPPPPILPTPPFFKFCPPPSLPYHLQPAPPLLFLLSVSLANGWSRHILCAILLNDNKDLHMSSVGTLVPEGPWCVFYATRCQVYWGLTHNVVFYWYSNLISHTQTHKYTITLTNIQLFTPPVMCSQQLPLLH